MYFEKSRMIPSPSVCPASPLPAPRAGTGIPFSIAYFTTATTSSRPRGATAAGGRSRADARLRGREGAREVVAEDVALHQAAEILFEGRGHAEIIATSAAL